MKMRLRQVIPRIHKALRKHHLKVRVKPYLKSKNNMLYVGAKVIAPADKAEQVLRALWDTGLCIKSFYGEHAMFIVYLPVVKVKKEVKHGYVSRVH